MLRIRPGLWAALMVGGTFDVGLDDCPHGATLREAADAKDQGFEVDVVTLRSKSGSNVNLVVAFKKDKSERALLGGWHSADSSPVVPEEFEESELYGKLVTYARERQRWIVENRVTWNWDKLASLVGALLLMAPTLVFGFDLMNTWQFWVCGFVFFGVWLVFFQPWALRTLFRTRIEAALSNDQRTQDIESEYFLLPKEA